MNAIRVALVIAALLSAAGALAQAPTSAREAETLLDRLERELRAKTDRMDALEREANALAQEDLALRRRLIRASEEVRAREADLSALEARLGDLDTREAALRGRIAAGAAARGRLLSGLVRLSRRPAVSWLDPRVDAGDAVRSAVLLRAALPMLEARAETMRADLADLAALRAEIEDQRAQAEAMTASLDAERRKVETLIDERESRRVATEAERRETGQRLAAIAAEAKSLRELQQKLERERIAAERRLAEERRRQGIEDEQRVAARTEAPRRRVDASSLRAFPRQADAALTPPVVGRLVRAFGERDAVGERTEGIEIETRGGAQVVAPFDGEIVFADSFGGYGRMLLIRHRGDYFSMVAGLARLDVAVGDVVLQGEPVGVMSGRNANSTLYLELRRKDRPIDPKPWLDQRTGKGLG